MTAREPAVSTDPSEDQAGRTARGALWLATNGVVVKASQTLVLLVLAAALAPSALGLVALGTLVTNASAVLASLGVASALVYWRGDVDRAARTAVTLCAGSGAVVAVLVWVGAPWLSAGLGVSDEGTRVIRGLIVTLPLVSVAAVTNDLLRRRLQFLRRIIPDTVSSAVGAVVAVVLVTQGVGVMALVVGQVVQGVLTLLLAWCVHPPVRPGWSSDDARGLLSYGGPLAGANLLQLVQLNVDYLIVSVVLGAAALGQYSLAFRLAFMPYLMIAVVVTGAAFPYLCGLRRDRVPAASVAVMSATVTMMTPVCVGLLLLADHLVLLGDKWRPGVPVVALLAGYAWLLGVGTLVQTVLDAWGRTGVSLVLRLLHLVLLVVVLLAVVDRGVEAVALGQLLVAAVAAGVALVVLRVVVRGFSLRALAAAMRPALVGALCMAAAMLAVRLLLRSSEPSAITLVLTAVAGLIGYVLPVWNLDRHRLGELARLIRGPR